MLARVATTRTFALPRVLSCAYRCRLAPLLFTLVGGLLRHLVVSRRRGGVRRATEVNGLVAAGETSAAA
jgi:hypothetical protein